ncbi:hypothetical protein GYA54_02225 [Candidatus Kuenenbacteria bacterium]|nr:hypothetical protein [Candidatus Kuenenbacteria bacterium]
MTMKINIDELEFNFKFKNDDNMPATMTLVIGQFEVRGFKVVATHYESNKNKFKLYPPSKSMGNDKWFHLFFTPDKNEWGKIEQRALEKFNEGRLDSTEVSVDDVPL